MTAHLTRPCAVPGCITPARSQRGLYCENHRQQWRRHGAPRQSAVTKRELAPFFGRAHTLIKRDTTGQVEASLRQLHGILRDHALATVADCERGRAKVGHRVKAMRAVLDVLASVDPVPCALTVAAMFLLLEHRPRRFTDDRSFAFQLVRRFRGQADLAMGRYWDHHSGKSKTAYRDLPVKAVECLAATLRSAYGRFVTHVVHADRRDRARLDRANATLDAAFQALDAAHGA